ncbi:MAG: DEAD/DEAH box helicase [Bacteroidales bacterium]
MTKTFKELELNDDILKAVSELGFSNPTPVQEVIIPKQLETTNDIVCLAQTGTGKTAAFGLPLIQSLDLKESYPQALILCPTRELCRQIAGDLNNYAKYSKGFALIPVYGGSSIDTQIRSIKKGVNVIVATPGRMVDLLERKVVKLAGVNKVILDEADEMLNMGFKEELDFILSKCPETKRTCLFSATLPIEVESIAKRYMKDFKMYTIGHRNEGSDNVKHYYYMVNQRDRYRALKRIADYNPDIYAIVFCRTRRDTQEIANMLIKDGYNADALHGELSQGQRDLVMDRFKNKSLTLLVATDVAARGIDVNDLTHVINYNLPDEPEQYTHRSGRTGRADKSGISIAIINSKEQSKIHRIEKILGKKFAKAKIPTGTEICSKKLFNTVSQIENIQPSHEVEEYMKIVKDKWAYLSKEDIIRKILSMEFNRFAEYYKYAPDINVLEPEKKRERDNSSNPSRRPGNGFSWVEINIGSNKRMTPRNLIRLLSNCGMGKKGIGRIDIRRDYSFLEISKKSAPFVIKTLNNTEYKGKKLTVNMK